MENKQTSQLRYFSIAGMLFLIPPFFFWGLWIYVKIVNSALTQNEIAGIYFEYLPNFLQTSRDVTLAGFIFNIIAIVFGIIGLTESEKLFKVISIVTIIVGLLMALINFQSLLNMP